jgi:hypothetical protein
MKSKLTTLVSIAFALALAAAAGSAQAAPSAAGTTSATPTRTDSRIAYHGGPVMSGQQSVYFVWYGCWIQSGCSSALERYNDAATVTILSEFISSLGSSPYFQINSGYHDGSGRAPSGALVFGGAALDRYSRGPTLTEADVAGIVAGHVLAGELPLDPSAIYVVLTSSDVTVADEATQFCLTCCNFHGSGEVLGTAFRYAFVGNPARCPGGCASQFQGVASPNANFAADAMAAWIAHALSGVVTNPAGSGWYDRYGLENSEKCEGTFGATSTVTNPDGQPAETNVHLGYRHYLLQQNWVNGKKGHCGLTP